MKNTSVDVISNKTRKHKIVNASALSALLLTAGCGNKEEVPPPNILWIVADDLGVELGCYGEEHVYTPHIDRLAAEGTLYRNMFTMAAVSSVSRSSLITGMYSTSIDCHQHRKQHKTPLPDSIAPITEYFRQAGYFVSNGAMNDRSKFGKTDYNFTHDVKTLYDGTDWRDRDEGQPFFAQVQISYPHRPFIEDKEYPVDPGEVDIPPYYPDHPVTRKDWAMYLETVQAVDRQVGIILQRLENEGLLDNTVVFFFGDQGHPHVRSKQFMYEEGTHTPLIVRWPNTLPGGKESSDLVSNIDLSAQALVIAGIEIPSSMHGQPFIGEKTPKREYIASARDRRDETVDRIRAIRTGQFRYIRNFYPGLPYNQWNAYKKFNYPVLTLMEVMHKNGELTGDQARFLSGSRPPEELYDIQKDPFCMNNLAADPALNKELSIMRDIMEDWLEKYDLAVYPEAREEIDHAKKMMDEQFKTWMTKAGLSPDIPDEDFLRWWQEKLAIDNK